MKLCALVPNQLEHPTMSYDILHLMQQLFQLSKQPVQVQRFGHFKVGISQNLKEVEGRDPSNPIPCKISDPNSQRRISYDFSTTRTDCRLHIK